jgi:hypothetical protein
VFDVMPGETFAIVLARADAALAARGTSTMPAFVRAGGNPGADTAGLAMTRDRGSMQ